MEKEREERGDVERRFCGTGVVDPFDTFHHPASPSTLFPTIACLYTQLARVPLLVPRPLYRSNVYLNRALFLHSWFVNRSS